jgi:hypothetical protein
LARRRPFVPPDRQSTCLSSSGVRKLGALTAYAPQAVGAVPSHSIYTHWPELASWFVCLAVFTWAGVSEAASAAVEAGTDPDSAGHRRLCSRLDPRPHSHFLSDWLDNCMVRFPSWTSERVLGSDVTRLTVAASSPSPSRASDTASRLRPTSGSSAQSARESLRSFAAVTRGCPCFTSFVSPRISRRRLSSLPTIFNSC